MQEEAPNAALQLLRDGLGVHHLVQMVHLLLETLALGIYVCHDSANLSQDVGPQQARDHDNDGADNSLQNIPWPEVAIPHRRHRVTAEVE